MPTRQAYFNGKWIEDRELSIPIGDPGFALGVTITERLRTFAGRVWRQAEHVERLRRSATTIGIDPSIADEIDTAITQFVERNESLRDSENDWTITAFATPGSGAGPTRCVHGGPLPFSDWAHQYESGVSLQTSQHRQTPPSCWPPALKCRSRMHYYLADLEAGRLEPGAKALLLDQEGFVGEGSTANLIAYRKEEGIVSPTMERILPGVSVAVLKELAEQQGIPFVERDLSVEEFRSADEAWLSSTLVCLLPAVRCDGQTIGTGAPGPVYRQMLQAWNEAVGLDIAEQARRFS